MAHDPRVDPHVHERPLGWVRVALTVTALGGVPLWVLLTVILAQLDPTLVAIDDGAGGTRLVADHDLVRAGVTALGWMLAVAAVIGPMLAMAALVQRVRDVSRTAQTTRAEVVEGGLPADTPWVITRRVLDDDSPRDAADPSAHSREHPTH